MESGRAAEGRPCGSSPWPSDESCSQLLHSLETAAIINTLEPLHYSSSAKQDRDRKKPQVARLGRA